MTTDLLHQRVTEDTALSLRTVDGRYHTWYPSGFKGQFFKDVVTWLEGAMRQGAIIYTGDPRHWADLCSVTFLNASHIVSLQKMGGSR